MACKRHDPPQPSSCPVCLHHLVHSGRAAVPDNKAVEAGKQLVSNRTPPPKPTKGLGDVIESALSKVGVTPERVERFLGRPCGCKERKQKLNQLSAWAMRTLGHKEGVPESAAEDLSSIIKENPPNQPPGGQR